MTDGMVRNDAATWTPAVRFSEHAPPPQPSENPLKLAPGAAVAIRVTAVSGANVAEQTPGQEMAAGLETMVPGPVTSTASSTAECRKPDAEARESCSATSELRRLVTNPGKSRTILSTSFRSIASISCALIGGRRLSGSDGNRPIHPKVMMRMNSAASPSVLYTALN